MRRITALLVLALSLTACVSVPDGLEPVRGFDLNKYLGTWYEVARLDHSFERGLSKVTATYRPAGDGGIEVVNRGYSTELERWKQADGRAYFVEDEQTGYLKVSFFGPFYGSYVIFDLDPDYQYSLVAGPNRSYLWLLAREPDLDPAIVDRLVAKAARLGFDTDALIFVRHDQHES